LKPRYEELAQQLIAEIGGERFGIGSALPSELELAAQHGVSRSTIRSALDLVQKLGLISRRKRAGIRVEAFRPRLSYQQSVSNIEDLVQFAAITERHVQAMGEIVCDQDLAARLGCEPGRRYLHIESLRVAPGEPPVSVCWTDIYLEPFIGAALGDQVTLSAGLVCNMVEARFGLMVAEVRQEIRAVGIPARCARGLEARANAHALEIIRHYVDQQGSVFQSTISVFPAERYTYAFRLQRQLGAGAPGLR
jgi:DNA-binding GntR family transcriptional regulator